MQAFTAPPLKSTIHKSSHYTLAFFQSAVFSPVFPWQRLLTVEILHLHALGPIFTAPRAELSVVQICLSTQLNSLQLQITKCASAFGQIFHMPMPVCALQLNKFAESI
jgi:hypothetical protein